MLKDILWVGTGSAIGGMSRYLAGKWISTITALAFPLSTFSINVLGSFIIGLLLGWQNKNGFTPSTLLFLSTGFCGGFTTFSTFSLENIMLIKQGNINIALLYMAASLIAGLTATYIGVLVIGE